MLETRSPDGHEAMSNCHVFRVFSPLVSSSVLLIACRAVGVALQAATFICLARVLPISNMGYFGVAFAFLGVVRFLGPLGADQVAMRELAHEENRQSPRAQELSIASLVFVGIASAILATGTAIFLVSTGRSAIIGSDAVVPIAFAVPAFALMGLFAGQTRGCGYNLVAQMPEALGLHLIFGCCVITLVYLGAINLATLLSSLCFAGWAVVVISGIIRVRIGLDLARLGRPHGVLRVGRDGFKIAQALSFTAISARAPVFLAAALIGPTAAAMLDFAARFGAVPSLITTSVAATFSPHFARLAQKDDRRAIVRTLRLSSSVGLIPAAAYAVILVMGARVAIHRLLPPEYSHSYIPMLLLCVAATVNAALGPASNFLLMSGQEAKVTALSAAQLVTLGLGATVLASAFGAVGIAFAAVFGTAVRDGGLMLMALRGKPSGEAAHRAAASQLTA
jgi:O-antigen/teichoic acid export membrane protein